MSLRVSFTQKPQRVGMSCTPLEYRAELRDGFSEAEGRIRVGVYMEQASNEGGFQPIYGEERESPALFDIAAVLDAELSYEMPPLGLSDAYKPSASCKRYFLASRHRESSEVSFNHSHPAGWENAFVNLPSPQVRANRVYRISAEYRDGYQQEAYVLGNGASSRPFFAGNEYLHEGRIVEVIYVEEDYPQIKMPFSGWQLQISELPVSSTIKWALKGRRYWMDIDLQDTPVLLSSMSQERLFTLSQEAWLWFSVPNPASTREFQFDCHYSDGSMISGSKTFNTPQSQPGQAWAFPISDSSMGYSLLDPSKQAERIVLRGMGQEVILKVELEGLPYLREFHFNNIKGGTDWLIAYGKGQKSHEWVHEEYRQFPNLGGRSFGKKHLYDRTRFSVSAGYRSKAERDAAFDLLRSELAFIREEGRMVPINVLSRKTAYEKDSDRRYTLNFEYAYAFEN